MLTIKHISSGFERIVQAENFIAERRKDGFTQFLAFDETRENYRETWCGDLHDRGCSPIDAQTIYVMNSDGATVATYRFSEPDFTRPYPLESGALDRAAAAQLQADPALTS